MFDRIVHIIIKEFRQIFRDKMMRFLIFLPPIMEMFAFGYAAALDVNNTPIIFLDNDRTPASRRLVERFTQSGYFDTIRFLDSPDQADALLDDGTANVCVFIQKGFEGAIKRGDTAEILIVVDGTDSSNASVVLGYINTILNSYSEDILLKRVESIRGRGAASPVSISGVTLIERTWYNEELKSRNFFIPGIMGGILTVLGVMLSSMSIVKEREIGTMEQLIVTPITPLELVVGKLIPFAVIAYVDVCLVTAIATFWFGVPFRGSLPFLFVAITFFFFANLGFGLLISTVSTTQQQAMMNTFLYFFPAMLLSGFAFPVESMPDVIIPITYANPMRHIMEILRGVFLKGMGIAELWHQLVGLFLIGLTVVGISAVRLRKRIV